MCKICGQQQELTVNPRIIGSFVDESGTLAGAELAWKNNAWTELFFGNAQDAGQVELDAMISPAIEQSWEDITVLDMSSLKDIQDQLLYSRVAMTFGWSQQLGRLCVLGIQW